MHRTHGCAGERDISRYCFDRDAYRVLAIGEEHFGAAFLERGSILIDRALSAAASQEDEELGLYQIDGDEAHVEYGSIRKCI